MPLMCYKCGNICIKIINNFLYSYISKKVTECASLKLNALLKRDIYLTGTRELFTISRRVKGAVPYRYKIQDYHGEELEGTFYESEMQKVIKKTMHMI